MKNINLYVTPKKKLMKKTFCDICGTEIPKPNEVLSASRDFKGSAIKVELLTAPERFDICCYCVVDIVK